MSENPGKGKFVELRCTQLQTVTHVYCQVNQKSNLYYHDSMITGLYPAVYFRGYETVRG